MNRNKQMKQQIRMALRDKNRGIKEGAINRNSGRLDDDDDAVFEREKERERRVESL